MILTDAQRKLLVALVDFAVDHFAGTDAESDDGQPLGTEAARELAALIEGATTVTVEERPLDTEGTGGEMHGGDLRFQRWIRGEI